MNEIQSIDEKSLQLVVKDEQLGSLITNAEQIRDLVKNRINQYSVENYNEDNIDQAKADKALLNKARKTLNDRRIELEKKFMQPFMGFKDVVAETVKLIDTAVKDIDGVVKASDEKAKNAKREQIEHIAEEAGAEKAGIKFSLIFNDKWLNKSTSLKKVREEISKKLDEINTNLATLMTYGEDYEILATRYKEALDFNATIAFANLLKAQKEAKAAKAEPKAEAPAPTPEPTAEPTKEEEKPSYHEDDDAFDAFADALGQGVEQNEIKVISITASQDDFAKVIDFLKQNNITFEIQ